MKEVCPLKKYLEVVLELVNDWPGRAKVPVGSLHLADGVEGPLGLQMILQGGHDVASACREGLELGLGLRLAVQGGGRKAEA